MTRRESAHREWEGTYALEGFFSLLVQCKYLHTVCVTRVEFILVNISGLKVLLVFSFSAIS